MKPVSQNNKVSQGVPAQPEMFNPDAPPMNQAPQMYAPPMTSAQAVPMNSMTPGHIVYYPFPDLCEIQNPNAKLGAPNFPMSTGP